MNYTSKELAEAALDYKKQGNEELYAALMAKAREQLPERQGWLKDWLGEEQTLFEEPQTAGGIAADTAKATGAGLLRGVQGIVETPEFLVKGAGRLGQEATYGLGDVPPEVAYDPFNTKTGDIIDEQLNRFPNAKAARDYRSEGNLASTAAAGGEFMAAGGAFSPKRMAKNAAKLFGFGATGEAAGKLLDETGYGDVARVGSALASPAALSAARRPLSKIDPQNLADARYLQGQGVRLSLSDITGSKPVPGVTVGSEKGKDYTKAILEKIGIRTGTTISSFVDEVPALISTAVDQLKSQMRNVTRGLQLVLSAGEQKSISAITDKFKSSKGLSAGVAEPQVTIKRLKNRLLNSKNPIDQDSYVSYRADLSELTSNKNPSVRKAAIDMLEALDGAVDRALVQSGNVDGAGLLAQNRSTLRDIYAVKDSLKGNSTGIIDPSDLRRSLERQNSDQVLMKKRGELGNLADAGDRLIPKVSASANDAMTAGDLRQLAKDTSPFFVAGSGAIKVASDLGLGDYIAPLTVATGLTVAAIRKLSKTDSGQRALIKRAMRSGEGQLGEDVIRSMVAAAASQTEDEDQQ